MYSLIIKNGLLVDGVYGRGIRADLAVRDGLIAGIGFFDGEDAVSVIDAEACLVTPGLIDHHTHLYPMASIGIPGEAVCFASGVTTAVDAGSTGCDTYENYRPFVCSAKLLIKSYINVCSTGLETLPCPENLNPMFFDKGKLIELFRNYGSELLGLKIRISKDIVGSYGFEALKAAVNLADQIGVPLMVHSTNPPGSFTTLLDCLRRGDIVTHMFHNTGHTILNENKRVQESVWSARSRGVLFEAADARTHFSFDVGEAALKEGFFPDFIATDLTKFSMYLRPTAFNMAMQVSKYCAMGMEFSEVIRRCTEIPAKNMGIFHEVGSFGMGKKADIVVFRICDRKTDFGDRILQEPSSAVRTGTHLYQPVITVKNGEMVYRDITF